MSRRPRVTERMIDVGMDIRFGSGWLKNLDDDYVRRSREMLRRQLDAAFELLEPQPLHHPGQLAIHAQ